MDTNIAYDDYSTDNYLVTFSSLLVQWVVIDKETFKPVGFHFFIETAVQHIKELEKEEM